MADGRDDATTYRPTGANLWADIFRNLGSIFRCFQVALDPRKLLVAAAGILAMSLGWYVLSYVAYYDPPKDSDAAFSNAVMAKEHEGENLPEDKLRALGLREYNRKLEQWKLLADLAAPADGTPDGHVIPGGRLRTLPWQEYRGENPYLLVSTLFSGNAAERSGAFSSFLSGTLPVLVEPLAKLFLPLIKFIDADANPWTRIYLLLCLLWSLAVWAFCGGVITRIAAVQLTGKDRVTFGEAVRFVAARYVSYVLSPVVPLGIMAVIAVGLAVYGMVGLIPWVGDFLLYGLGLPVVLIAGLVMSVLLVGLVGYPMMYATISTEGSDTFDALSRAYNYVFQAPWTYLWYSFVAVLYGAAVTLLVVFLASLTVYLSKWSVGQAPFSEGTKRKADYLYVYAPQSFGWRELFLRGSVIEEKPAPELRMNVAGRPRAVYVYSDPVEAERYLKSYAWYEWAGAGLVSFWLTLAFLLMLGFSYSYFWSAAAAIYLLMRKKVDDTDPDELYVEEELPDAPLTPAPGLPASAPVAETKPATIPLTVSPPPVGPPPAPVVTETTTGTTVKSTTLLSTATDAPANGEKAADAEKKPADGEAK